MLDKKSREVLLGVRLELTFMLEIKSPVMSNFSSPIVGANMGIKNSWESELQVKL